MMNDFMEDDTFAFGLETSLFPSFCDGKKHFKDENNNLGSGDVSQSGDLLSGFGLQSEDVSPGWSLLAELEMTSAALENQTSKSMSTPYSIFAESSFNDEFCQLSPLSDSGDSGIGDSTCPSPLGRSGICSPSTSSPVAEDQFFFVQETEDGCDNVNLPSFENPSDLLADLVGDMVEECSDGGITGFLPELNASEQATIGLDDQTVSCFDEDGSGEIVEIHQVPFIEENKLSPDVVQEAGQTSGKRFEKPIEILPRPANTIISKQKVFLVKAEPTRTRPYPKEKPARQKTTQQKEKKRNQNRNAATRYRNKKKDEFDQLFEEASQLEADNKGLQDKVTSLSKEIDYLKGLMLDVIKAKLARSNSQPS